MTPRALLAAIGSTAIAFAIAIGIAAGSASSPATPVTASAAGTQTIRNAQPGVVHFSLQANQDCRFAV